jgi:hypothetical protein
MDATSLQIVARGLLLALGAGWPLATLLSRRWTRQAYRAIMGRWRHVGCTGDTYGSGTTLRGVWGAVGDEDPPRPAALSRVRGQAQLRCGLAGTPGAVPAVRLALQENSTVALMGGSNGAARAV